MVLPGAQRFADSRAVWRRLQTKCRLDPTAVEAVVVCKLVHHFLVFTKHRHEDAHELQQPAGCNLHSAGPSGQFAGKADKAGPGERLPGGRQVPRVAERVRRSPQHGQCAAGVRGKREGVHGIRISYPLRRFSCLETLEHGGMRKAVYRAGTVKVGRPDNHRLEIAAVHFIQQHVCDLCPDLALPADRVERRILCHQTVHAPIGIDVVEEDETAAVTPAGVDDIAHHFGPLRLPDSRVVLQAGHQIDNLTTGNRAGGCLSIQ